MSCGKELKKKRTKNTSNTQYEIYLNFMETDYCFRSGTINPTLDDNYLTDKWKELSNKLNACGDGPALTVEEWQRRFRDWKYSTKAKYRKLHVHRLKTGSGPPSDIKISDLEDRGLSVWGKATVTGAPNVTSYEGVEIAEENSSRSTNTENNNASTETIVNNCKIAEGSCSSAYIDINDYDVNDDTISISLLNELPVNNKNAETNSNTVPSPEPQKINDDKKRNTPKHNRAKIRPTPLSELAANLSNHLNENNMNNAGFKNILQTFSENYIHIEKEKLILEREKLQLQQKMLKFEIEKYKYENKDFEF